MMTHTAGWRILDETKSAPSGALTPAEGLTTILVLEGGPLLTDSIRSASPESIPTTAPKTYTLEEIVREGFYRAVDQSGDCWEWTHRLNNAGYGIARVIGRSVTAHRLSWVIEHGQIPDGLLVLHKCDNRRCVRPDHLFLGTNLDNSRDKIRKGRGGSNRLDAADVRLIRKRYAAGGVSTTELANEYGVGVTTIAHIIHRRTWAWLEDEVA